MGDKRKASVSQAPSHDGDGYGWGGDYYLTIGFLTVNFGPRHAAAEIAKELAELWNTRTGEANAE